ncbi:MAG: 4Fe-4S binding protein [Planctomycetota bacterium]|nr:4Fe-4S binding protein [Planctomycetota bacterium]MDP6990203.1 4Fe-4S binding protein [Planctomycetota bacterium]
MDKLENVARRRWSWLRFLPGLRPAPAPQTGDWKLLPLIDHDECSGCGRCVEACGEDCIELIWAFATLVEPAACTGDGACVTACPRGGIQMQWLAVDPDGSLHDPRP